MDSALQVVLIQNNPRKIRLKHAVLSGPRILGAADMDIMDGLETAAAADPSEEEEEDAGGMQVSTYSQSNAYLSSET